MLAERKERMLKSFMEASGNLVVPAVFKTDVADTLGQAGSIPVRLLHPLRSAHLKGESGDYYRLLNMPDHLPHGYQPRSQACAV